MGQNQSQRKAGKDLRGARVVAKPTALCAVESSVDPEVHTPRDLGNLLANADTCNQADTLASLPVVPCDSGGKSSVTDDQDNNNSIRSVYDMASPNDPANNVLNTGFLESQPEIPKDSAEISMSVEICGSKSEICPDSENQNLSAEKIVSKPNMQEPAEQPSSAENDTKTSQQSDSSPKLSSMTGSFCIGSSGDTFSKSFSAMRSIGQKKKSMLDPNTNLSKSFSGEKGKGYIPNIKPNVTASVPSAKPKLKPVPPFEKAQRKQKARTVTKTSTESDPTKNPKSFRIPSIKEIGKPLSVERAQRKVELRAEETRRKKAVADKVKDANSVYDTETTKYVEELCVLNHTSTRITEDNRVRYVTEDENDDHSSANGANKVYSNVIFFPDRSKGATPKRYGPKRLGSIHPEKAELEQSNTDSDDSSNSTNDFKSMKTTKSENAGLQPNNFSNLKFSEAQKVSENIKIEKLEETTSNKKTADITQKDINAENKSDNSLHDVGITKEKKEENKSVSDEVISSENTPSPEVKICLKEEKVAYCVTSEDQSMIGNDIEMERDIEAVMQKEHIKETLHIPMASEPSTLVNDCKTHIVGADVDSNGSPKVMSDSEASPSESIDVQKENVSSLRRPNPVTFTDKDRVRSKKVNISATTESVSYRAPIRTAVDDLQTNMAADVDWSTLRSRQARYAGQLKSCRTSPGEDNRMALEFSLPAAVGYSGKEMFQSRGIQSVRDFRRSFSSGSESDFNSNVNDFDSDDDCDDKSDDEKRAVSVKETQDHAQKNVESNAKVANERGDLKQDEHYPIEIVEKYGPVMRCLRRRKTNFEDDNRIVITDNEAVCVEFDDEEEDDNSSVKSDDSSPDVSVASSSSVSLRRANRDSDSDDSDDPYAGLGPLRGLLDHDLMQMMQSHWRDLLMSREERRGSEEESPREEAGRSEQQQRKRHQKGIEKHSWAPPTAEDRKKFEEACQEGSGDMLEVCEDETSVESPRAATPGEGALEIQLAEDSDSNGSDSAGVLCVDGEDSTDKALEWVELDALSPTIDSETLEAVREHELPSDSRCTLLCIDTSASMKGKPWKNMENALKDFVTGLEEVRENQGIQEHVGVVVFGQETRIRLHLTTDYQQVLTLFRELSPGGCSPVTLGLLMCCYPHLMRDMGKCVLWLNGIPANPRIILFTDGHPTPLDLGKGPDRFPDSLHVDEANSVIKNIQSNGSPHIDCVAVSDTANMDILEAWSGVTGGRTVRAAEAGQLACDTYNHYIAAHVGGAMLEAGEGKIDEKVFQKLVWTVYPSVTETQLMEITDIIKHEVQRRSDLTENDAEAIVFKGDQLEADMKLEKKGLLPLGTKFTLGPDYKSEFMDCDKGIVISHNCSKQGHVRVQWANGICDTVRCGHENAYDIMPDENCQPPNCRVDDPIRVGLKVRRGPDWAFGNQDGGSDQLGTVYGVQSNGDVLVRWPNSNVGNYRHGHDDQYDVLICDPKDPHGTNFYTKEMNRRNKEEFDIDLD